MQSSSNQAGVAIVGLDHRFVWVNPALCDLLGYAAKDLIGCTFESITYPGDAQLDAHLADRLSKGELSSYQFDKRYIDRSGKVIPIHLTVSLIRDSLGQPIYFLSLIEEPQAGMVSMQSLSDLERIRSAILM